MAFAALTLPEQAQQAVDKGKIAAGNKDWALASDYFNRARQAAPLQPEPLYYLGLAETQIPGRELRAIAWLEAYLMLAPRDAEAVKVRKLVINEMEVRAQSRLDRVYQLAQQLADKMDDTLRPDALERVNSLTRRKNDLTSIPKYSDSKDGEPAESRAWVAEHWIALAERCMKGPTFLEFDRALSNTLDGHPLQGHYEPSYDTSLISYYGLTPAEKQASITFRAAYKMAEDILLGLRDIFELRNIVQSGVIRQAWPGPVVGFKDDGIVCNIDMR
jgi:hypothetical protein